VQHDPRAHLWNTKGKGPKGRISNWRQGNRGDKAEQTSEEVKSVLSISNVVAKAKWVQSTRDVNSGNHRAMYRTTAYNTSVHYTIPPYTLMYNHKLYLIPRYLDSVCPHEQELSGILPRLHAPNPRQRAVCKRRLRACIIVARDMTLASADGAHRLRGVAPGVEYPAGQRNKDSTVLRR